MKPYVPKKRNYPIGSHRSKMRAFREMFPDTYNRYKRGLAKEAGERAARRNEKDTGREA